MADRMFPCAPRSLGARRGLSGTALKLLALALMLLDHIHYFFAFTGAVPLWFTQLGRLSAPLFLFCTVEGFAHTRNRRRYFGRIWAIAAGMGLVQFCMQYAGLWRRPDGFVPENGIFLNFVVLLLLWQGVDWLRQQRFAHGLAALLLPLVGWPAAFTALFITLGAAFPAASPWLQALFLLAGYTVLPCWMLFTDGGIYYILLGLVLYLLRGRRGAQAAAFVALELLFDLAWPVYGLVQAGLFTPSVLFTSLFQWMAVFAVVPMLLYNGRRGRGCKALFYAFYPAHIYLLYALSWWVVAHRA